MKMPVERGSASVLSEMNESGRPKAKSISNHIYNAVDELCQRARDCCKSINNQIFNMLANEGTSKNTTGAPLTKNFF
jgi:hypothetical protein